LIAAHAEEPPGGGRHRNRSWPVGGVTAAG
jgi:hypothetical protein